MKERSEGRKKNKCEGRCVEVVVVGYFGKEEKKRASKKKRWRGDKKYVKEGKRKGKSCEGKRKAWTIKEGKRK